MLNAYQNRVSVEAMQKPANHRKVTKKSLTAIIIASVIIILIYMPTFYKYKPIREEDFEFRLNLSHFTQGAPVFIEPLPSCPNHHVKVFIIVCSAAENFSYRQAIRSTWGSTDNWNRTVQVFFLVGRSYTSSDKFIDVEKDTFNDVIHYNLMDTYLNLTLKSFMLLEWVRTICATSQFIMKVDDDTFVNVPRLLDQLNVFTGNQLLLGHLIVHAAPVRDPSSKWYTPKSVYAEGTYPNYLSGSGYVMSIDALPLLYKSALHVPFLCLEDIFITGICAKAAGLTPRHHSSFSYVKPKLDPCIITKLITAHRILPDEQKKVWHDLRFPRRRCPRRRDMLSLIASHFTKG